LKGFPAGNTGTTMGGWFNKEINTLNDFKGLKMRIPGLGGEIINRLGGTSINLSGGEVISSLKLGVIDAAEWAGPWPDTIMGFHKVAKYYYGPGIHEPNTLCEFMINKEIWNNLPYEYQVIIENASYASYLEVMTEYFYKNAKSLRILKNKYNIDVRSFNEKIVNMFFLHSQNIIKENLTENLEYKKIYNSWKENIELFNEYHRYSDNEYMKLRLNKKL
jgi:TRAP-type mannitol/chloroaromatic compound transport system substrate-binding protein